MVGFVVSNLLILLTSYIIVAILQPKNSLCGFIYLVLLSFAQIIGVCEVLSLFKILKPEYFLCLQAVFFSISIIIWIKRGSPLFNKVSFVTLKKIIKSILSDKALLILSVGYVFFIIVSIFLASIMGITSGDGEVYHVARSFYWVKNATINHFETSQVRMLAFPINSELLYTWLIMFKKSVTGIALFSFVGYILSMTSLYGIMENYSINRKLWVIFICSSFSSVLVQAFGIETDIMVAGLILASMYLYKLGLKNNQTHYLYFSALAYAISLGTKTTAFFLIPAVGIYMIYNSIQNNKLNIRPFLCFIAFGIINFIAFSSYNYISNFMTFGNVLGSVNTIELHKNHYGLGGLIANFIKNSTLFFDFTGFTWNSHVEKFIIPFRDEFLGLLGVLYIPDGINSGNSNVLNNTLLGPQMGLGILGLLVFVPSLIIALLFPLVSKSKIAKENCLYSIMFFVTLAFMSYFIAFMTYNNRFIASFVIVISPVLGCVYFKKRFKFLKGVIVIIALFYLTLVSTHIWSHPASKIAHALFIEHQTIKEIQNRSQWRLYKANKDIAYVNKQIVEKIREFPSGTSFLIFNSYDLGTANFFELLNEGYKIDFKLIETVDLDELQNYDVIIYEKDGQGANIAYRTLRKYPTLSEYISCKYVPANVLTQSKSREPVRVHCKISQKYWDENNYQVIDSVNLSKFIFLKK